MRPVELFEGPGRLLGFTQVAPVVLDFHLVPSRQRSNQRLRLSQIGGERLPLLFLNLQQLAPGFFDRTALQSDLLGQRVDLALQLRQRRLPGLFFGLD